MNTRKLSPPIFTTLLQNILLCAGWFATYKIAELMANSGLAMPIRPYYMPNSMVKTRCMPA